MDDDKPGPGMSFIDLLAAEARGVEVDTGPDDSRTVEEGGPARKAQESAIRSRNAWAAWINGHRPKPVRA